MGIIKGKVSTARVAHLSLPAVFTPILQCVYWAAQRCSGSDAFILETVIG